MSEQQEPAAPSGPSGPSGPTAPAGQMGQMGQMGRLRPARARRRAPNPAAALAPRSLTRDLQPDARAALRNLRVSGELRAVLDDTVRSPGVSLHDLPIDEPYTDSEGKTLQRHFSELRFAGESLVLLEVADWIVNDGANIGALTELRDMLAQRKVRIVSPGVQSPDLSLLETLPRIWRAKAEIDLRFVSWRYVQELLAGRRTVAQVFGIDGAAAPQAPPAPAGPPGPPSAPAPPAKKALKRVFIGSTARDLHEYRLAARDVCIALDLMPKMMEYFEAMGRGATAGSLMQLELADIYVGIFAYRYGYIEEGHDKSVTEIEFDHAAKMERLCFVVDPKVPWPPEYNDPEHHDQMTRFKQRVGTLIRGTFKSPDDFKAQLMQALLPHRP